MNTRKYFILNFLAFLLLISAGIVVSKWNQHHYQVWVNESPVLDSHDWLREHETLSVLERVFASTKATAIVEYREDGKYFKREYENGRLVRVPGGILGINVQDGVHVGEKVN